MEEKMIRFISILSIIFIMFINVLPAQEGKPGQPAKSGKADKTELVSEELQIEGQKLDEEIEKICKKIKDVIVNYKLTQIKDIKVLPYRTNFNIKENYIELEKYLLERDYFFDDKITGIHKTIVKIYFSGDSISKIESEIIDQQVGIGYTDRVIIIDPSPLTPGTDDIIFTQVKRNVKMIDNKKLGEIKNNRVAPIKNSIKKEFIIPHINFLYDSLLSIAETYYKGIKDADAMLYEFLKKSTKY